MVTRAEVNKALGRRADRLERENARLKGLIRRLTRALFDNGMSKDDIEAVYLGFDPRDYGEDARNGG